MDARRTQLDLLALAGRLLLEYNESTGEIQRTLAATARVLSSESCEVVVSYSGIAVSLGEVGPALRPIQEIRYNTAVLAQVHAILSQLRAGALAPTAAMARLERVETDTPRHAPWIAGGLLGAGAAALAGILGADLGAAAVAAISTGSGQWVRQWLRQFHFSLLALPLAAAFLAGVLGSLAIHAGWTQTPGLALIVPCLMLVPGPHLINGLLDLIDNYLPMSLARLGLAAGILIASSAGLFIGIEAMGAVLPEMKQSFRNDQLKLLSDMVLAGVVTGGFAIFYNASWKQTGLAMIGGAIGHGLRFLLLSGGVGLEAATFAGSLAVGLVAAWIARQSKCPAATMAFAGAVTMMPGLQLYSALRGGGQLVRLNAAADLPTVAGTLAFGVLSAVVVAAIGLGLVAAIRIVQLLAGDRDEPGMRSL